MQCESRAVRVPKTSLHSLCLRDVNRSASRFEESIAALLLLLRAHSAPLSVLLSLLPHHECLTLL